MSTGTRKTSGGFDAYSLREARKKLNLTQQDLAEHLGFHRDTIVQWEKNGPPKWMRAAIMGLSVILTVDC